MATQANYQHEIVLMYCCYTADAYTKASLQASVPKPSHCSCRYKLLDNLLHLIPTHFG